MALSGTDMNSKILCNWLGIVDWPPDHYALLGLKPGEGDALRIEQQVQERMAKLRCYQLSHPEEATEGMNRVAQAFICLTETLSKQSYDQTLPGPASKPQAVDKAVNGPPAKEKPGPAAVETQQLKAVGNKTDVDWKNMPPPVRAVQDLNVSPEVAPAAPAALKPAVVVYAAPAVPEPIDTIFELAHESTEARRGLGTLRALIERINLTRRLILAWIQAGKYLSNSGKKLNRPAEEADLTRRLNKIFEWFEEFPKIVGHPGQPGYRVVAMARLEMTAQMFKMLDKTQREDLARDWDAGYRVLLSHRQFLRRQFKILRNRGPLSLGVQAIRAALNDHPFWVSTGGLLTIGLCIFLFWKVF